KEFGEAKRILAEATAQNPRVLWPHVILSHVLLQEGQDLAAEEALRDVLALDPDNAEARHNLCVLLQRQNRASDAHVAQGLTLADLYQHVCTVPSGVQTYLPILFELASRCRHVTVLGARHGLAATALLFAQPDTLVCYDLRQEVPFERLKVLAGRSKLHF